MLLCSVRDCRQPLARDGHRLVCARGHSFDISRHGYINLLQPQERRSKRPGDTAAAVAGRRRLHDLGVTTPLLDAIADLASLSSEDRVVDAGCGDGFYLGSLAQRSGMEAHGVDISVAAIEAAARRYPQCEWIVANADRFLPFASSSMTMLLSITARRNAEEFSRVLRPGGRLLVAVPAADDLIELRGEGRDRVESALEWFSPLFTPVAQRRATTSAELDANAVNDVLHSVYRPMGTHPEGPMRLTFSLDLLLFRKDAEELTAKRG